jgi:hydroxypyruvate reductase
VTPRELLADLYSAAVAGADVESLTANAVALIPLDRRHRVWVFAFGKAAPRMAAAAVSTLQRALAEIAGGLVVSSEPGESPFGTVKSLPGDHPVPGPRSLAAASAIGEVLSRKRGGDLGIVLLSGGASSLIAAPLRGMSAADLSQLYEMLLVSGLDIHQVNAVRKRFSFWAAGRMALALAPARTHCLAVSDVPGDDLATIGSGPCVPDPVYVQDVIDLLRGTRLFDRLPTAFRQYLIDSGRGVIPETPKATHPAFAHVSARVVANNSNALQGAAIAARRRGFIAEVEQEPLVGDASEAGDRVAGALLSERDRRGMYCRIWGGETTVEIQGSPPRGGRCQELALSAAARLARAGDAARGITILVAGTDGRDGNGDAAGAIVDAGTWQSITAAGRNPEAALRAHESYDALASAGALFKPGPTGTNVMDVTIALVERKT